VIPGMCSAWQIEQVVPLLCSWTNVPTAEYSSTKQLTTASARCAFLRLIMEAGDIPPVVYQL